MKIYQFNFQNLKEELCEVMMVELANRRAPLFRGSGWETRPGLAVAFPKEKVGFIGYCSMVVNLWV